MNKKDADVFLNMIRCFNKRLSYAIEKYGEDSLIVTTMKDWAQSAPLKWCGNEISESEENLKSIEDDINLGLFVLHMDAFTVDAARDSLGLMRRYIMDGGHYDD